MENSRKRSSNWDDGERALLREVITPRISIIHNKNTDSNTNNAKKKAWEEVFKCFNLMNTRPRSMVELKSQWKTCKMRAKKSDSNFKKQCRQTGGGPRPASPSTEDKEIMSLVPSEFEQDHNIFDGDGEPEILFIESEEKIEMQMTPNVEESTPMAYQDRTTPNGSRSNHVEDEVALEDCVDSTPFLSKKKKLDQSKEMSKAAVISATLSSIREQMEHKREQHAQAILESKERREYARLEHIQLIRHREELHQLNMSMLKKKHLTE